MASSRDRDFTYATIVDLKEFAAELRKASPEIAKKLQVVNKRLVEGIAARARARAYSRVDAVSAPVVRDGPVRTRRSGRGSISRSRESIRGTASQREARVVGGGPKAPGFFGHEFGGSRGLGGAGRRETRELGRGAAAGGRHRRRLVRVYTRQFPVHKGRTGYFLYPTVREAMPTAFEDWNEIFDEIMGTKEGPS